MWRLDPRVHLLLALLSDWLGELLILVLILRNPTFIGVHSTESTLQGFGSWLVFILLLYPLLGWLFGSYTVLNWRRLSLKVLLQRLLITSFATFTVVELSRWLFIPSESVLLFNRFLLPLWITALTIWSLFVRVCLRRGFFLSDAPRMFLLCQSHELSTILAAWRRVPHRQRLRPIGSKPLEQFVDNSDDPIFVVLSDLVRQDPALRPLLSKLDTRDPRQVRVVSVLSLFEQHQQRLPPVLMADNLLTYDDLPVAGNFNVQAQLKRISDLFIAAFLLLFTSPFVLLAAGLIWLEDRGPVFYAQQRSGWLGRPFTVYKLRTMIVQPPDVPACWTELEDQRITSVGGFLRRMRLDELPQLLNVINGDMSLIGPRPERPELEEELEQRIPHYCKRHWMRPGLSGWAQVCSPYASSFEDSDFKLSYDLYYLRHFSVWLDLLILLRTLKTVLKAGGR